MTQQIPFVKVVGAGNDFILVDRRGKSFSQKPATLAKTWCNRKQGIGANGLLWIGRSAQADAKMRIFNPDGSEAAMCGNGLRCVTWYLHNTGRRKKHWDVETPAGVIPTEVVDAERVRAFTSSPKSLRLGLSILHRGKRYSLHAVNTGVPHAVLFVSRLNTIPLATLGPAIRYHRLFKPRGANVNWVQIDSPHRIQVRTYERGVEAETLACGTGAIASAVIGTSLGRLKPPIQVATASGERLKIGFRQTRQPWEGLYMEGPARVLFSGVLPRA
jgi:diaminopimelate epimerase